MQYHSTPDAVTGTTPSDLFLGHPLRIIFDLMRPNQRSRVEECQAQQKRYHDKSKRQLVIGVGDRVRVRVYHKGLTRKSNRYWGP